MPANSAPAFSAGLRATLLASNEADKRRVSNLLTGMAVAFGGTEIIRAGNHISLASPIVAKEFIVPKSVVTDLADQIERTAAQVQMAKAPGAPTPDAFKRPKFQTRKLKMHIEQNRTDFQDIPGQDDMAERLNSRLNAFFTGEYDELRSSAEDERRSAQRRKGVQERQERECAELDDHFADLLAEYGHAQAEPKDQESVGDAPAEVNFAATDDEEPEAVKIYDELHVTASDRAREK